MKTKENLNRLDILYGATVPGRVFNFIEFKYTFWEKIKFLLRDLLEFCRGAFLLGSIFFCFSLSIYFASHM